MGQALAFEPEAGRSTGSLGVRGRIRKSGVIMSSRRVEQAANHVKMDSRIGL